jgi:hypothetical protein
MTRVKINVTNAYSNLHADARCACFSCHDVMTTWFFEHAMVISWWSISNREF